MAAAVELLSCPVKEVREGFDRNYFHNQPFEHGTKYTNDGGVTLGVRGHAVALRMLDPTGRNGQPGASSGAPAAHLAYYFLARGETWGFTKRGRVILKK